MKILLLLLLPFLGSAQVVYNPVDSTYIITKNAAAKLAYLAERGTYVDTLLPMVDSLYSYMNTQNVVISNLTGLAENYEDELHKIKEANLAWKAGIINTYSGQNKKSIAANYIMGSLVAILTFFIIRK